MQHHPAAGQSAELHELSEITLMLGYITRRHMDEELARYNLTAAQFAALRCVEHYGNAGTLSQLASAAHQLGPTMTGIIDRLEERGLVVRRRSPQDRRSLTVSLTETGADILASITDYKRQQMAQFLESLPAEDRQTLLRLLRQFLAAIAHPYYTLEETPVEKTA